MCCCIGFCLCTKKFNSKHYTIIAIICNSINLTNAIIRICLIGKVSAFLLISNFFDILFTIINLIFMIIILIHISKRIAFDKFNNTAIILCNISMIFSGIIIVFRILFIIIVIILIDVLYNLFKNSLKNLNDYWAIFVVALIFCLILEIINSLVYNYLYRLLKLKTSSNYDEYLKNKQSVISQDFVINTQIYQNQNDVIITTSPQIPEEIPQKLDSHY